MSQSPSPRINERLTQRARRNSAGGPPRGRSGMDHTLAWIGELSRFSPSVELCLFATALLLAGAIVGLLAGLFGIGGAP
jgi:hypothetical protein